MKKNPKRWLLPLSRNMPSYAKSRFQSTVPLSNLFPMNAFFPSSRRYYLQENVSAPRKSAPNQVLPSTKSKSCLYISLIPSLMDYCCIVFGNTTKKNLDRLPRLQKRVARLILDADYKSPFLPLFLKLNWLSIQDRIKFFRCLTVFKILNNLVPLYLSNLIEPFRSFRNVHNFDTRGSCENLLKLPRITSETGKRSFTEFLAVADWNSLNNELRNAPSLQTLISPYFKKSLSVSTI